MAIDMFLKIGDLKGESTVTSHKDEIHVLAWSWGMSQSGDHAMRPRRRLGQGIGAGPVDHALHRQGRARPIMAACTKGSTSTRPC